MYGDDVNTNERLTIIINKMMGETANIPTEDTTSIPFPRKIYEMSPGNRGWAKYGIYVIVQSRGDEAVIDYVLSYYSLKRRCIRLLREEGGIVRKQYPNTPVLTATEVCDELCLCLFCGREPEKDDEGWMYIRRCMECNKRFCAECSNGYFLHCPDCEHLL